MALARCSSSNPSMVRLFLSSTKYVHRGNVYRRDNLQKQTGGVKERITNDNCAQRDAQLSMAFFLPNPVCSLFISIAILGSTYC